MGAHGSVLEQPTVRSSLMPRFPPVLRVRPQHDETPDHFAALFRFGALMPSSSRRRTASDREISLAAAHASIASITSCGTRAVRNGSRPVAGRPRFFGVTVIDLRIV
jgi:hypothetical protein